MERRHWESLYWLALLGVAAATTIGMRNSSLKIELAIGIVVIGAVAFGIYRRIRDRRAAADD